MRTDGAVSFNWGAGSPAPGNIGTDNFCVRWTGYITLPQANTWCFQAVRDDGVIRPLLNRWRDETEAYCLAEGLDFRRDTSNPDTKRGLIRDEILPRVNAFCYGQVKSAYGSGQFKKDLDGAFPGHPTVVTSEIRDKAGIYDSIKEFLGKGN